MQIDRRTLVIATAAATAAVTAVAAQEQGPANPAAATSSRAFPNLFTPVQIGGVRLKNRIVHAVMASYFADGSEPYINYYANRARGGTAMIVTHPPERRDDIEGVRRLVNAVERHDCRLVMQLSQGGRMRTAPGRSANAVGASALPDDWSWTVPHALRTSELKKMVDDLAQQARDLKSAGVSGVEISASHGHLMHQMLTVGANQRDDEYGGDLKRRSRYLTDTISAIRAACGRPFIIGLKLVGEDGAPGGIDLAQSKAITALAHATGELDYITYGWGTSADTLYWHAPKLDDFPRLAFMDKIRGLAQAAPGVPLGAIGLITDPTEAETIIRDKQADLVMLARPIMADAAWALKASEGRQNEIRKCVSCDTCWQVTAMYNSSGRCDNNPRVGAADEADWKPAKAATAKRVVVVGGGVAGLEAAWVAAGRGHQVTLFAASQQIGGKTRLQATLPGGGGLPFIFDYQRRNADRYGVQVKLGKRATLDDILAIKPDAVVLATGSTMTPPPFLPKGTDKIRDLRQVVADLTAGPGGHLGGTAVIYDHDHTHMTYTAAEYLRSRFDRVVLVTPRGGVAADESVINRQGIYHRLSVRKVEILIFSTPLASSNFSQGKIICASSYDGSHTAIDGVTLFTYSTPRRPNDELAEPLRTKGIEPVLIGDCWAPRVILTATIEGHKAGASL